ncbi:hypothetical protein [Flavobacterium sp.]|uniref:hypothetical protein n=1 Tax=Flavobacterium sp. TaxID=239 RepID=UPI002629F054|nr:hypothetical protein [Flavobacterium sp.]
MVRIVNYQKRLKEDGKEFFILELQSGIELVLSQKTGQYYATAKKANISSTFDEETCKALIGTDMPGNITKTDSAPYEYTIKDTGEIIILTHRYVYTPEVNASSNEDKAIKRLLAEENTFSKNSQHKEEFVM